MEQASLIIMSSILRKVREFNIPRDASEDVWVVQPESPAPISTAPSCVSLVCRIELSDSSSDQNHARRSRRHCELRKSVSCPVHLRQSCSTPRRLDSGCRNHLTS